MRQQDPFRLPRKPWNAGRLVGATAPLKPKHIWAIRAQVERPCSGLRALQLRHRCETQSLRPGTPDRERCCARRRVAGAVDRHSAEDRPTRAIRDHRANAGRADHVVEGEGSQIKRLVVPTPQPPATTSRRASTRAWWIAGCNSLIWSPWDRKVTTWARSKSYVRRSAERQRSCSCPPAASSSSSSLWLQSRPGQRHRGSAA
jgi:hypothetical protein